MLPRTRMFMMTMVLQVQYCFNDWILCGRIHLQQNLPRFKFLLNVILHDGVQNSFVSASRTQHQRKFVAANKKKKDCTSYQKKNVFPTETFAFVFIFVMDKVSELHSLLFICWTYFRKFMSHFLCRRLFFWHWILNKKSVTLCFMSRVNTLRFFSCSSLFSLLHIFCVCVTVCVWEGGVCMCVRCCGI